MLVVAGRSRKLFEKIARAWREGVTDANTHYKGFTEWREKLADLGLTNFQNLRLLDIGCGDRAPLSALFASEGARVEAIDLLPVYLGWRRPLMWPVVATKSGLRQAVKQAVRDSVHTWRYWHHLRKRSGGALPFSRVHFQEMDATALTFPDDSFDLVISSAVWEHIDDVRRATQEVNRVLTPGGLAVIQVAVFPALKGGHHPEWHSLEPDAARTIRPWDHLRPGAKELPLFCNGWRASQYEKVFREEMSVSEMEEAPLEGSEYLTPDLREELADFSETELLMPFITIWAHKRPLAPNPTAATRLALQAVS